MPWTCNPKRFGHLLAFLKSGGRDPEGTKPWAMSGGYCGASNSMRPLLAGVIAASDLDHVPRSGVYVEEPAVTRCVPSKTFSERRCLITSSFVPHMIEV